MRVLSRIFGGLLVAVTILFAGTSSSFAVDAMPDTQQNCEASGYQWVEDKCCIYYSNKLGCITFDSWASEFSGLGCDPEAGYIDDDGDFHCCPGEIGDSSTHLCCTPPEVFDIAQEKCVMGGCPYNWYWNESTGQCCVFYYFDEGQNDYVCVTEEDFKNDIFPGIEDGCENPPYNNGQQAGYVDEDGNWQCCPPGTIPNGETYQCDCGEPGYVFDPQAAECVINCDEGYFWDGECKLCPDGYTCLGGASAPVPNIYTITLRNYNNTSTHQTIYEKYNTGWYSNSGATTTLSSATAPSRTGYTFRGFYTSTQTDATSSGNTGTQRITAAGGLPSNATFIANTNLYAAWARNCVDSSICALTVANNGAVTYTTSCPNGYVSGEGTYNPVCQSSSGNSNCYKFAIDNTTNGGTNNSNTTTEFWMYRNTSNYSDAQNCKIYPTANDCGNDTNVIGVNDSIVLPTPPAHAHYVGHYSTTGNNASDPTNEAWFNSNGVNNIAADSSYNRCSNSSYTSTYFSALVSRFGFQANSTPSITLRTLYECNLGYTWNNGVCTANTITLDWDENGGSAISNGTCTYGGNLVLPSPPTRVGYTFDNWWLADGTYHNAGETITGGCTDTYTGVWSGTSSSIHAQWTNSCVAIRIVTGANGGNVTAYTTLYKLLGQTGWYIDSNCEQATSGPTSITAYKPNATFVGIYDCPDGSSCAGTGTLLIGANGALQSVTSDGGWVYPQYDCNPGWRGSGTNIAGACTEGGYTTITLNNNSATGGSCDASVNCTPGASCALPQWNSESCNINKGSKIFVGWTTTQPANHDGNTTGVFNITGPNSATTYYAVWQDAVCNVTNGTGTAQATTNNAPLCQVNCSSGYHTSNTYSGTAGNTSYSYTCAGNSYAVHFNDNCPTTPSGTMSNQPFTYGQSQNLTANAFSCEGYGFAGWADSADGAKVYDDQQLVSNLITSGTKNLYAKWDTNTITCAAGTYLPAGGTSAADCTACTLGSYCPGWTGAYDGNEHGRFSCQGRAKYTNTTSATSCKSVSSGYYSTGCDANGNTCTGQTQCTGATYCSGGIQHNCPDGYTDNTSNGKTSASSCRIQCAAGTRVIQQYGQCVTDNDDTWVSYANTVYYGSLSTVTYCGQGTRTSGTAATDHDAAGDCQGSVSAGHYASSAALSNVTAIKIYSASQDLRIVELAASASAKGTISDTYPNFLSPSNVATGNGIINPAAATDTVYNNGAFTTVPQGAVAVWDGLHIDNLKGLRIAMFAPENSNLVRYRGVVIDVRVGSKWINIFHGDLEQDKRLTESKQGYSISTGGIRDAVCDAGKYTTSHSVKLTGTSSCTKVTAGYWNNGCGTTATGDACSGYNGGSIDAGYYGDSGATSAIGSGACAEGSYSTGAASACTVCPDGYTTSGTGSTACTACLNNANVTSWVGQSWSPNAVSNLCVIASNGCASGYERTGSSPYTCEVGVYAISLDSDFYSSASASVPTAVDTGATPTTIYEKYNTGWYQNNAATTPFTELNILPAYGNRLFYGFWTGKTGTGTKIINSDGSLADTTATVFSSNSTAYAKWSAANVCTCTTGTNVSSCSSTGVTNNKCQYTYNCTSGYTIDGSATAGTFEGAVGTASNESPACNSAGSYSITYTFNGGSSVDLGTYMPVEYIENSTASGNAYIESTGIYASNHMRAEVEFMHTNTSDGAVFGNYQNNGEATTAAYNFMLRTGTSSDSAHVYGKSKTSTGLILNTTSWYKAIFDLNNKEVIIGDGTTTPTTTSVATIDFTTAGTIPVFVRRNNSGLDKYMKGKIKYLSFYNNGTLVFNGIPVRVIDPNNTDYNRCGLYDTASNTFFGSSSSKEFSCPSVSAYPTVHTTGTATNIVGKPVRANSKFEGWYTNSSFTGNPVTTIAANVATPQVLYAKWSCNKGYTLSGNTCVANTITVNRSTEHGTAPATPYRCTYDTWFDTPAAISATNYIFGGWTMNGQTFTEPISIACTETNLGTTTGPVTFTAGWTKRKYTLTLTKGYSGSPTGTTCSFSDLKYHYVPADNKWYTDSSGNLGTEITGGGVNYDKTCTGYTFRGWYWKNPSDYTDNDNDANQSVSNRGSLVWANTSAANNNAPNTYQPYAKNSSNLSGKTLSSDTTLYARWAQNCASVDHGSCSLSIAPDGYVTYGGTCNTGYSPTPSDWGVYNPTCTLSTCDPGYYMSSGTCTACGAGYYCTGGTTRSACPTGLTTANDTEPKRHDEAGDCGRPFHLGTDTLWLRSSKKTHTQDSKLATVALNFDYFAANGTAVKDGGAPDGVADLFLNLSTTASPMPTTNKNFKMTVNGSTVYGCDDGTCQ